MIPGLSTVHGNIAQPTLVKNMPPAAGLVGWLQKNGGKSVCFQTLTLQYFTIVSYNIDWPMFLKEYFFLFHPADPRDA